MPVNPLFFSFFPSFFLVFCLFLFLFVVVVFAVDCDVCRTVSQLIILVFGDMRFDLVWSNCELMIRPEVTQCG